MTATVLCSCFLILGQQAPGADGPPLIGDSTGCYTLAKDNTEVRGIAFDDVSPKAPRLFALDRSGKIFVYGLPGEGGAGSGELGLLGQHELPKDGAARLADPRGLAFALDGGREIFYLLDWKAGAHSHLWRCDFANAQHTRTDLSWFPYRIGLRETLDLACDRDKLLICYDASGYHDNDLRVTRGLLELRWRPGSGGQPEFSRHLPDSGEHVARGIAGMEFDGARYLWVGAGSEFVYAAEARTGRGLFFFDRPRSGEHAEPQWGLCCGGGWLWVPEGVPGPDRIHRVNVRSNLDAPRLGPRRLRHLKMTITTRPEQACEHPGAAYHYFSRPYPHELMPNQGTWPETEQVADLSEAANATIRPFTYDPAGDAGARQHMSLVEYADAPAREYRSRYEIDLWTGDYVSYVYPHRVDRDLASLRGTDYLADDPELFDLADKATYDAFHARVQAHVLRKYGTASDADNPYWVARDALEYIQDHYYYPGREQGVPAAVDYDRKHYDANPGNLKLALSDHPYDRTQITACSGTSVMLAGALRSRGFEARWLGTGNEVGPADWDKNKNGLLDAGESAAVTSGHRYTQVWLGGRYGWICFDATPTRPEFGDYDPVPPIKSQWRYMNRAARGHLKDTRIVFNIGSGLFRPLYRDFEYDAKLAVNNDCGGDQRYNLQGRFEKPELWQLARHRIAVTNTCFLEKIATSGAKNRRRVTWIPRGDWQRDPGATVSLYLERRGRAVRRVATLASGIPWDARQATVDLSSFRAGTYQVAIRKDGDPETGGNSQPFELD